jgi:D-lactate dehydrogenase (cytochrome)
MNAPLSPDVLRKPLPAEFMDGLHAIFGGRVSLADAVREHHGRDESPYPPMPPDAVVFAHSTEEVVALIRLCSRHRVPVIPYGVGTSLEGHLLALHGGISVDLSQMNKVLAINPEDLTVTVQAGVTRKQLNQEIRDTGFFFPIDPDLPTARGGFRCVVFVSHR